MAITLDATSADPTPGVGGQSWTHSGGAGPRAALIIVVGISPTNEVSGATYGGVAMTALTGSPWASSTSSEGGIVFAFLLNGVSSGSQTAAFTTSVSTQAHLGVCFTLNTGGNDVEYVNASAFVDAISQADPTGTLSLSGRTCFVCEGLMSGQAAVASITQPTGWSIATEATTGSESGAVYSYDTIGSSDVTVGWTQTADDAFGVAIAVSEVVAAAGGQPITKRHEGVPHMGLRRAGVGHRGGAWGRTRSGIIIPRWLKEDRRAA